MSDITFALGIPHAAYLPERVKTLDGLICGLETQWIEDNQIGWLDGPHNAGLRYVKIFGRKCHHSEWASETWHWQLKTGASHCLTLQDDVRVMPRFWEALHAMVTAVPDQVLALETVHPAAKHFAREHLGRWITTADGLIGVQYVFPHAVMREFLEWQRCHLERDAERYITEDLMIDCFLIDTDRKAWHPIPAIAEHDTDIPSTNKGHDAHPFRNVTVKWSDGVYCAKPDGSPGWTTEDLVRPEFWLQESAPQHMGRFYGGTHAKARQWVPRFGDEEFDRVENDLPPAKFAKEMGRVR